MDSHTPEHRHVLQLAFGLPLMTTTIVMGSMYIGHVITTQSDRPARIDVNVPQAAAPKIDVNVPQAAPPKIEVSAAAPRIDVHVPGQQAPQVTVNTPAAPAPNITINPAAPTVTVIDRREDSRSREKAAAFEKPAEKTPALAAVLDAAKPASGAAVPSETPKPAASEPLKPLIPGTSLLKIDDSPAIASMEKAPTTTLAKARAAAEQEPTLESLYTCAAQYADAYCKQQGLDPAAESEKWARNWKTGLEQSVSDNMDSGEQSYINRMVISKRDCFSLETASPAKVAEGCRIMLRYRDANLVWLQAMKDAMTQENLKKTVAFLSAGPKK